jgi:hypothetical protein
MKERDKFHFATLSRDRTAKDRPSDAAGSTADFLDIAGLQAPNPLLYRSLPLTCARSQE